MMNHSPRVEPMDEHNRALLGNVHPADWVNPGPAGRYNLVVIGGGTAGLVSAAGAAGLGAKVALVEKHLLGGDCLNTGCVPSKCIIRSARAAAEVRGARRYGVRIAAREVEVDFPAVMERMRRLRSGISRHDSARRLREMGVDLFLGEGRFAGPRTVEVDGKLLHFSKAVIATGARPVVPGIPGLEEAGFLTSETVFSLTELPRRLAVIGGGPLGCELAQAFQRLGSRVTVIQRASRLLPREDPDAARILAEALERDGVALRFETTVARVEAAGKTRRLHLSRGGRSEAVDADEILVGAGRRPNVEGLGLEAAGIDYHPGRGVLTDDRLRTTNRHVFAAGDVCLRFKFTHTADAAARIVIQNALFGGRRKVSALAVPWCTYTDPEIAHVGMCPGEAEERGIAVDTITRPLSEVDRAVTDGEEEGFVRVHLKRGSDRIVGATVVARHAGEMISELTLAMAAGVGLKRIASVIHPYPTRAEGIRQAADAYNRGRLTPRIRKLFARYLAWRR